LTGEHFEPIGTIRTLAHGPTQKSLASVQAVFQVAPTPISSRFLCPRPPLLLSAPNQNRHATQAINELIYLTVARIDYFLETPRPPAYSVDAPKHKAPVSPSVSPEVVPGNVEHSNDSVEFLNSPASPTTHETVSRVKLP